MFPVTAPLPPVPRGCSSSHLDPSRLLMCRLHRLFPMRHAGAASSFLNPGLMGALPHCNPWRRFVLPWESNLNFPESVLGPSKLLLHSHPPTLSFLSSSASAARMTPSSLNITPEPGLPAFCGLQPSASPPCLCGTLHSHRPLRLGFNAPSSMSSLLIAVPATGFTCPSLPFRSQEEAR